MGEEDDLQLPDVLKKLEIFPYLPVIKLSDDSIPLSLNPFYFQLGTKDKNDNSKKLTAIFGPKCNCYEQKNKNSKEHSIINRTSFKHKNTPNVLKTILKEPILKTIQNCIHYNHVRHKMDNASKSTGIDLTDYQILETRKLEEHTKIKNINKNNNFLDFRILIEECDKISSINSNPADLNNRSNFTTIQSNDYRLNKISKKFKKSQLKMSKDTELSQNNSGTNSCAQQARISAPDSTTCDITIDELASYFETFVHIPKKMSSMAEMMYI